MQTAVPDSASRLLQGVTRTSRVAVFPLAANEIARVPGSGTSFYIVDCDSDAFVGIKTDKTSEEFFTVGTGKSFTAEQFFGAIELRNTSASAIVVTMFIGFGDYIDHRTNIVGNRLSSILPVIEPKTKPLANPAVTLAAATALALSGVAPSTLYLRRKAIVVSNIDPNNNLQVRDAANIVMLTIFPQTSITLPLSESCNIFNPNVAAVALSVGEIWWMKP